MKRTILFTHSAGSQEDAHEGSNDLLRHLRAGPGPEVTLLAPRMPSPDSPSYASWKQALDALIPTLPR